ncbi:hypothetical protein J3R30DRAFT_2362754 [Lentinula aciculospora]|uniref:Uncharacterized protein n=1 Tax=Lentinula aciculospora TaxID=153920 RepID=A0A9W9AEB9_9AGAR|nr:hypothetical protein J3R30DRAFT_2362754 [Lentinula aciculospora]
MRLDLACLAMILLGLFCTVCAIPFSLPRHPLPPRVTASNLAIRTTATNKIIIAGYFNPSPWVDSSELDPKAGIFGRLMYNIQKQVNSKSDKRKKEKQLSLAKTIVEAYLKSKFGDNTDIYWPESTLLPFIYHINGWDQVYSNIQKVCRAEKNRAETVTYRGWAETSSKGYKGFLEEGEAGPLLDLATLKKIQIPK